MTSEERLDRIEHITAGIAEERRKDREESRQLWRDTQRQIDELTTRVSRMAIDVDRLILEAAVRDKASHERDHALGMRIEELAAEAGAADKALGARIESLVSGIGEFIASQKSQQ